MKLALVPWDWELEASWASVDDDAGRKAANAEMRAVLSGEQPWRDSGLRDTFWARAREARARREGGKS